MYHKITVTIRLVKGNTAQYVNSDLADYVQISNVEDIIIHRVKNKNSINRTSFQLVGIPL